MYRYIPFPVDNQKLQVSSMIEEMQSSVEAFSSVKTQKKSLEEVRHHNYDHGYTRYNTVCCCTAHA